MTIRKTGEPQRHRGGVNQPTGGVETTFVLLFLSYIQFSSRPKKVERDLCAALCLCGSSFLQLRVRAPLPITRRPFSWRIKPRGASDQGRNHRCGLAGRETRRGVPRDGRFPGGGGER